MIPNVKPSQVYPIAAEIAPVSIAAAGNATTPWTLVPPGSKWAAIALLCGVLGGGSEQVDVQQANTSGGGGAKALATNLVTNAVNGTFNQAEINIDAALDINNGFQWIQAKITNTGGTGALVGLSLAFGPSEFMT